MDLTGTWLDDDDNILLVVVVVVVVVSIRLMVTGLSY